MYSPSTDIVRKKCTDTIKFLNAHLRHLTTTVTLYCILLCLATISQIPHQPNQSIHSKLRNNYLYYDVSRRNTTSKGEITDNTVKRIMHTYIDRSGPYVDEELLEFWNKSWTDADWETKLLTPKDAENHSNYKDFNTALKIANICCLPRETYLRHLAMSTINEGGFFSELYVFPLRTNIYPETEEGLLPNGGHFTSWDGIFGSLISGSHDEWNRMTKVLFQNIEKNVVLSLQRIYKKSPKTYHHGKLLSGPSVLLSMSQFTINLCEHFADFAAIRFHAGDVGQYDIVLDDRIALIKSWYKIYNAKCLGNRPVIYTFYEPVSYLKEENPDDLLEVWKSSWSDAGWEPVVLNLDDAKRHPKYKRFVNTLDDSLQFEGGKDRYNYFCFMRWAAAAASGGGWMADYDTFPLNLEPSFELPNKGQFTGHAFIVPNLVSGSVSEWNRMTELVIGAFIQHRKSLGNSKTNEELIVDNQYFFSDLLATKKIFFAKSSFLAEQYTRQIDEFYLDEIESNTTNSIDPYNLSNKCKWSDSIMAIHFSHWACSNVWFCREEGHRNSDMSYNLHVKRSEVVKQWLKAWKEQCKMLRKSDSNRGRGVLY